MDSIASCPDYRDKMEMKDEVWNHQIYLQDMAMIILIFCCSYHLGTAKVMGW